MKVNIPFKARFREPMLAGVKTMTSRTRRMGQVGDTFEAFGATFEVDAVDRTKYGIVVRDNWREEGCESPKDLVRVWQEIHPRKQFTWSDVVWAHTFHMVTPPATEGRA